jgi:1-acyl-sn-glycerol-3-phosphate acyltransferase
MYPVVNVLTRIFFDLEVRGSGHIPRNGPAVLIANHEGYLDPVFVQMGTSRTIRFMMTSDFYDIKAANPVFRLLGAIRVAEDGPNRDSLREALGVLREGGLIGIFPEGRLSRDGKVGPVLPGAAFLAAKGKAPVIPARIDGSYEIMPRGRLRPRQAAVSVTFGPPVEIKSARGDAPARKIMNALAAVGVRPGEEAGD